MDLWTDRESWSRPSRELISKVIKELERDEFAILAKGEEDYIQTMLLNEGYLLERRAGSADEHFEALPLDGRERTIPAKPWWAFWLKPKPLYLFEADEIVNAFCEFLEGNESPDLVDWARIRI